MPLLSFLASLWQQLTEVGWLQWLALVLGVSEVLLARANKIALYPAGIAASAISIYLLWTAGLYGESALNFYYVVVSIYGWWFWHTKRNQPAVKITKTQPSEWWVVAGIIVLGYVLLYVVLTRFTPSTVPHLDSFVTVTAWAGTWLLARRKLENWLLLNVSNIVAIPLLYYKGLLVYALLTAFLFVVAVQGYFAWKNKMKKDEAVSVRTN